MGCATGLVKSVMFVFNFLFVLAGIGLIAIGALYYLDHNDFNKIAGSSFELAPTLALIIGIIVFVIAFFGCCGVIRESHCMLTTYAIILLVLLVLQIGVGIFAYMQADKSGDNLKDVILKHMNTAIQHYDTNKEIQEAFDVVQQKFKCCGAYGPNDYRDLLKLKLATPASCCINYDGSPCPVNYYTDGCADKIYDQIVDKINYVFYACVAVAGIELFGAIFAFCLASSVKNESRRRYP